MIELFCCLPDPTVSEFLYQYVKGGLSVWAIQRILAASYPYKGKNCLFVSRLLADK